MKFTTLVAALLLGAQAQAAPLEIPDGKGGIGFDDLLYAPALQRVLVPAGRTGRLVLVDPRTRAVEAIAGFSSGPASGEGHGAGTTSADSDGKLIFASDRNLGLVDVVDVAQKKIVGSVKLGGGPDYVRWVEPLGEVWVTEPGKKRSNISRSRAARGRRWRAQAASPSPADPSRWSSTARADGPTRTPGTTRPSSST